MVGRRLARPAYRPVPTRHLRHSLRLLAILLAFLLPTGQNLQMSRFGRERLLCLCCHPSGILPHLLVRFDEGLGLWLDNSVELARLSGTESKRVAVSLKR